MWCHQTCLFGLVLQMDIREHHSFNSHFSYYETEQLFLCLRTIYIFFPINYPMPTNLLVKTFIDLYNFFIKILTSYMGVCIYIYIYISSDHIYIYMITANIYSKFIMLLWKMFWFLSTNVF